VICAVHAAVGAALGRLAGEPKRALAAGVASHLLGYLLPHKDFDPKVEAPLLAVTLGVLAWRCGITSPEFVGAVGAVAPDVENAASRIGLIRGEGMQFPTHRGAHCHGPVVRSAWPQGLLAAACLAYVLLSKRK